MNYFRIFEIPETYAIDMVQLDKSYVDQQRKFHPDRFVSKPENERIEAAQKSADVNDAYRILKDDLLRAQYLLKLKGVIVGREAEDTVKPGHALLEELMELGEKTESAGKSAVGLYKSELEKALAALSDCFDASDIQEAAQQYFRAKFLWRLIKNANLQDAKDDANAA